MRAIIIQVLAAVYRAAAIHAYECAGPSSALTARCRYKPAPQTLRNSGDWEGLSSSIG
jgi:hypothetical protein